MVVKKKAAKTFGQIIRDDVIFDTLSTAKKTMFFEKPLTNPSSKGKKSDAKKSDTKKKKSSWW